MRLIDADELNFGKYKGIPIIGDILIGLNDVAKELKAAPTIDAVPVVRCKDCIDYEPELGTNLGWCPVCSFVRWDDDFCSYGEREAMNEKTSD